MNDIKKLLGLRIKELRKMKKMSQQVLAEKANIDQRSLSHIECGDNFPSKSLLDLAKALEISLPDLFDFEHLKSKDDLINSINTILNESDINEIEYYYRMMNLYRESL